MKKTLGLFILFASLLAGACLLRAAEGGVRYSACVVDESEFEKITARRNAFLSLPEALIFDGETLHFDLRSGIYYYSLVQGSAGAYDPHIRIQSRDRGVRIAFLEREITDEVIAGNTAIPFLLYTDDAYARYELKCTTLPLMDIEYEGGEIGEDMTAMSMTLFDNAAGALNRVAVSDGTIHVRGNTTKVFPKKGYRLSLVTDSVGNHTRPNQTALLGMRQDDDWILYPAYNDQEKVRNVFCTNLWKASCAADNAQGIDTGTEYRYLELFLNGEYWGLYALGYPVDEKQLSLDPDSDKDGLYKGVLWSTDGNIAFTEGGNPVGFRIKGTFHEAARSWKPLLDYEYLLWENRNDTARLYQGIDIDNAIDIVLFYNLIQGGDNVNGKMIKNLYLAIREGEDGPTALYAPWDMDLTWGNWFVNDLAANLATPYQLAPSNHILMQSGYLNQILVNGDEEAWDRIYAKYRKLRETAWSQETIGEMLDEYEADIYLSGAYLREMERWPEGSYADAADGLGRFRKYVSKRLQETDRYYEKLNRTHEDGRTGYELKVEFATVSDAVYYLQALQYADCTALLAINDTSVLQDERYAASFAALGLTRETVGSRGGVFVLRDGGAQKKIAEEEDWTETERAYAESMADADAAAVRITVLDAETGTALDGASLQYVRFDEQDDEASLLLLSR